MIAKKGLEFMHYVTKKQEVGNTCCWRGKTLGGIIFPYACEEYPYARIGRVRAISC